MFGDESGSFRNGDWQVIGVLMTSDPATRRSELAEMRTRYRLTRELKFSDTDVLTLPYGLAVIDWFLNTEDLRFAYIAKSGDTFDLSGFAHGYLGLRPEELAYNYSYKELLRHNLPAEHRVVVTVDQQSRTKNNNLLQYLKEDMPMIRDVIDGDSKADDLLQVVDLLTGCAHGSLVGITQGRKVAIMETFLRGCGMASARTRIPTKVTRSKVNAWIYRTRETSPRQP